MERDSTAAVVHFVLAARAYAATGLAGREHPFVREFRFCAMGTPDAVRAAGLEPDAIVDEVWRCCHHPVQS